LELILKGRGLRITEQIRKTAEHKVSKIERIEPRVQRMEIEIVEERNPRIKDGSHRVEVTCDVVRHVFRAQGTGPDVNSALDQVIDRLGGQISRRRGRLKDRRQAGPMG
jgi:ribosomal subunit interface protein